MSKSKIYFRAVLIANLIPLISFLMLQLLGGLSNVIDNIFGPVYLLSIEVIFFFDLVAAIYGPIKARPYDRYARLGFWISFGVLILFGFSLLFLSLSFPR
ncbi:MAG: hypothetical protein WD898_00770 [Candidatus Paceibacterota bacterium]